MVWQFSKVANWLSVHIQCKVQIMAISNVSSAVNRTFCRSSVYPNATLNVRRVQCSYKEKERNRERVCVCERKREKERKSATESTTVQAYLCVLCIFQLFAYFTWPLFLSFFFVPSPCNWILKIAECRRIGNHSHRMQPIYEAHKLRNATATTKLNEWTKSVR